ncbi:MAG TPA: hypothetical protein VHG91_16940 [Longimicrobium sp.]|nr:hypothetical protein [Longimicrobium sp.]
MKKLNLEALAVTSFDTGVATPDTERWSSCFPDCNNNPFTLQQDTSIA